MAICHWIDGHRGAVAATLVLGPPAINLYPLTGLINPLWGSLYGFPLHLASRGHLVYGPHAFAETLAFFVWPLIVLGASAWLAGQILASDGPWRLPLTAVWFLSILFFVPVDVAMERFTDWPLYGAFE